MDDKRRAQGSVAGHGFSLAAGVKGLDQAFSLASAVLNGISSVSDLTRLDLSRKVSHEFVF
jgi:hypothetical protein